MSFDSLSSGDLTVQWHTSKCEHSLWYTGADLSRGLEINYADNDIRLVPSAETVSQSSQNQNRSKVLWGSAMQYKTVADRHYQRLLLLLNEQQSDCGVNMIDLCAEDGYKKVLTYHSQGMSMETALLSAFNDKMQVKDFDNENDDEILSPISEISSVVSNDVEDLVGDLIIDTAQQEEDCQTSLSPYDNLLVDPYKNLPYRSEMQSPITALKVKQEHLMSLQKSQVYYKPVLSDREPYGYDTGVYASVMGYEAVPLLQDRPTSPNSFESQEEVSSVALARQKSFVDKIKDIFR